MIHSRWHQRSPQERTVCSVVAIGATMAASQLIGGAISASGASSAGDTINQAGQAQSGYLKGLLDEIRSYVQPYITAGTGAVNTLSRLMGINGSGGADNPLSSFLLQPFNPTQQEVEQQPGYQFRLDQGLKQVQSGFSAAGLGTSGNATKGAVDYATGTAASGWQQDFNNYWTNRLNIAQLLGGLGTAGQTGIGQYTTAAGQLGTGGASTALTGAQGSAAGTLGTTNAIAGGLTGAANSGGNFMLTNQLLNNQQNSNTNQASLVSALQKLIAGGGGDSGSMYTAAQLAAG